jgi:hypothetical protein
MRPTSSPPWAGTIVTLVALVGLGWVPARAQQGGVFGATVEHHTEEPLAGVRVTLIDVNGRTQSAAYSDEDGDFQLELPHEGQWTVAAELIGYGSVQSDPVLAGPHDRVTVEIRLTIEPVTIEEPIVVTAVARMNPDLRDFYTRMERGRKSGFGRFMSREDIDRIRPIEPTDVLRMTPGVRVVQGGVGRGKGLRMSGGTCVPAIYIDGVQINRVDARDSVDDFVAAQAIEGIEVYRGAQQVGRFFDRAGCGLVLVWTRRGEPDPTGSRSWLRLAIGSALFGLLFLLH